MTKTYRVAPGRVVVPPRALLAGPGATSVRFTEGQTITFDDALLVQFGRYVRRREAVGDVVEVNKDSAQAAAKQ